MDDDDFTWEERKLYEDLYNLIGAKIRFFNDGYLQEGIISVIKPEAKRVTLKNVYYILPDKRVFSGALKYRFKDLHKYEVVATAKELNPYTKNEYIENLVKNRSVGKKYSINDLFFGGLLSDSEDEGEEEIGKEAEASETPLDVPKHLEKKLPSECVILDSIDLEWKSAMKHIGNQKVIGVSFHGHKVSRLGKLSWVSIGTSWCVFLIDIEKLGVEAFDSGLRTIFESTAISKVIHDCRFPSDCLAHLYNTKLANVFDTLVADFVVSMQCYNDKYKYQFVQSLNSCLRNHLDVLPEFTYVHDRCVNVNDVDCFSKRPVNDPVRFLLIKDTTYLLLLHKELSKKLLGPLQRNVERYIRVISGATQQELDAVGDEISSPDCIPPSLLMYGIQTVQFKKPVRKAPVILECKFRDPVSGKLIGPSKHSLVNDNDEPAVSNRYTVDIECNVLERVKQLRITSSSNGMSETALKKSVIVDERIVRPSARQVDDVYHKLVNNQSLRQNSQTIFFVKPADNYISKFTMRKPIECNAFEDNSDQKMESVYSNSPTPVMITGLNTKIPDYSDTWAMLRACSEACDDSKSSSFKFVPAGMPC